MKQKDILIKILVSVFIFFITGCKSDKIKILGVMKEYRYDLTLQDDSAITKLNNDSYSIERDSSGYFSIEIAAFAPKYLKLAYLNVYAEPGDEIILEETPVKNKRALYHFKGDHAEENNFLYDHFLHVKSCSWCEAGNKVIKYKNIHKFIDFCDQEKEKFLNDLDLLKASVDFKKNQREQIEYHYYWSLLNYAGYLSYYEKDVDVEKINKEVAKRLPKEIIISDNDSEIARAIIDSKDKLESLGCFVRVNDKIKEFGKVQSLIFNLNQRGISTDLINQKNNIVSDLKNQAYIPILEKEFGKYNKVTPNAKADDIEFVNVEGDSVLLRDYKGKTLVIDVWATWCGPCMKEKPFFAELAKKYRNTDQLAFLAVSVDDTEAWNRYLVKHHEVENITFLRVDREKMNKAFLTKYIPRFIILDKEQKIVNAFAPKPSDPALEELIQKQLGNY